MSRPWLLPALVVVAAFGALALRGYPWQLAAVAAGAIGALTYALRRTMQQMRKVIADHQVSGSRYDADDRDDDRGG